MHQKSKEADSGKKVKWNKWYLALIAWLAVLIIVFYLFTDFYKY
jgi:hypothetical protein